MAPPVVGYYSSTRECHKVGKLPLSACAKAIEQAGAEHDARSPLYAKLKACEAAAGTGNCEPAGGDYHRTRLQALIVIKQGDVVTARSLYAVNGSPTPFKDLDGNAYSIDPDTAKVSDSVLATATAISPALADATGGIGDAAKNIH